MSKMEWIDDNHIFGEMSDSEFQTKIYEEAVRRNNDTKKYGRDGYFYVYTELALYKGIPYAVKICRYFQIGVPLNEIHGMNSLGKWAVLESVPETRPLSDLVSTLPYPIGNSEWMWRDTLHTHNDKQTLKQMVDEMHQYAREDIDELDTIWKRMEDYMKGISDNIEKIREMKASFLEKTEIPPQIGGEKMITIPESELIKWSNDNDPDHKDVSTSQMWTALNRLAIKHGVDFGDE